MSDSEPRCPGCGEDRLIEWDGVLRRWVCAVCGWAWAALPPARERRVPAMRAAAILGGLLFLSGSCGAAPDVPDPSRQEEKVSPRHAARWHGATEGRRFAAWCLTVGIVRAGMAATTEKSHLAKHGLSFTGSADHQCVGRGTSCPSCARSRLEGLVCRLLLRSPTLLTRRKRLLRLVDQFRKPRTVADVDPDTDVGFALLLTRKRQQPDTYRRAALREGP